MKKAKKYLLLLFFIALLVFIFLNYNEIKKEDTKKTQDIKVVLGSEPSSLDPAISLTIDSRAYLSTLFEGLVNIDEKGKIHAGVAEKWTANKDNTEFIFNLRKNAKWSDGSKVIASDFKYAWLRVLNPETSSGWASYLYYIDGAEEYNSGVGTADAVGIFVEDEYTLKVKLTNPCSFFVSMTALQPYYPVKETIVKENGSEWSLEAEKFVSNGSFTLKQWSHDERIIVEKNEEYWNKKNIKLSSINFELFSDSNAILNSYEANKIDFVANMLTYDEMTQVDEIKESSFVYTKFLALNTKNQILKDKNVRKAISIALDRTEISKMMGNGVFPLTSFVPAGFYNIKEQVDYIKDSNSVMFLSEKAKIKEAKSLLEKSNYKDIKLTYLTNDSSSNIALAEIVQSQLKKIGIELNIQILEKKVFNEYRKQKNFDIVAASWAAEYPDISSYLYGFRTTDLNNYSGFSDSEFDNLYNLIMIEGNNEKKFELTHKAEKIVMDSYSVAPLYYENTYYVSNDKLENYYYDITGCLVLKYSYVR